MQAYRWVVDSRDEYTDERLEHLAEELKLDDCQNIGMCTATCPKELDPQASLQHLMELVKDFKDRKMVEEII
jgi:succinate dehydrogenase (ubiquinone) iron-sulfur subunit